VIALKAMHRKRVGAGGDGARQSGSSEKGGEQKGLHCDSPNLGVRFNCSFKKWVGPLRRHFLSTVMRKRGPDRKYQAPPKSIANRYETLQICPKGSPAA
jgi:hypothetical protein